MLCIKHLGVAPVAQRSDTKYVNGDATISWHLAYYLIVLHFNLLRSAVSEDIKGKGQTHKSGPFLPIADPAHGC